MFLLNKSAFQNCQAAVQRFYHAIQFVILVYANGLELLFSSRQVFEKLSSALTKSAAVAGGLLSAFDASDQPLERQQRTVKWLDEDLKSR